MSFMVDLTEAFPTALRDTARLAVAALTPAISDRYYEPKNERQIIRVCGDDVWLPRRLHDKVYQDHAYYDAGPFQAFEAIADNGKLTSLQEQLFFCLLTRHHNGFVREAALKRIIAVDEPWVVPYVVQLASEYVYEILVVIGQNLGQLNSSLYGSFLRDNPSYFAKVKQRIISYWNVYYRWHDYTGPHGQVHHLWREGYLGHDVSERFKAMESGTPSGKSTSL
jgi:hypothetical protein